MTGEHLDTILKTTQAKPDKEGWMTFPEGGTVTLYLAHDGVSLTIQRIEAIRVEGELVYARTPKRERFAVAKADVYAVAMEGAAAAGQPARRAGFG